MNADNELVSKNLAGKFGIALIAYFLVIIVIAVIEYNLPNRKRELLGAELRTMAESHRGAETPYVDFTQIQSVSSWDRVYIFGPYSSPLVIDIQLRKIWITSRLTNIANSEDKTLLVFTKNDQIVQYLVVRTSYFNKLYRDGGYAYDEARFVIDEESSDRQLLKWHPSP